VIADPFTADGSAREREGRLFDFLAEQAAAPAPQTWRRLAEVAGRGEDLGYLALLLSNLTEGDRARAGASEALYRVAQELLGPKLAPAPYEVWLKKGMVDVPHLAGFLDAALRQLPLQA
jgi:hypothetical protein